MALTQQLKAHCTGDAEYVKLHRNNCYFGRKKSRLACKELHKFLSQMKQTLQEAK